MPALDNSKWEQFAQFIVAGESQAKAYELAFGNSHPSVVVSASQLIDKQPVSDRINELRRIGLGGSPVLTLARKREYLLGSVTTPVGKIDENSVYAQKVKRTTHPDGSQTVEIESVNKLKALELDAKLAGEFIAPTNQFNVNIYAGEKMADAVEVESEVERLPQE